MTPLELLKNYKIALAELSEAALYTTGQARQRASRVYIPAANHIGLVNAEYALLRVRESLYEYLKLRGTADKDEAIKTLEARLNCARMAIMSAQASLMSAQHSAQGAAA